MQILPFLHCYGIDQSYNIFVGGYVQGETGCAEAMDNSEDHRNSQDGRRRRHRLREQPT